MNNKEKINMIIKLYFIKRKLKKFIRRKDMNYVELRAKQIVILANVKEKLEKLELEEVCKLMEKFDELNDNYMKEKKWVKN